MKPSDVTAPLLIRLADGRKRVIAHCFDHPDGLLAFEPFWGERGDAGVHVVSGPMKGDGPWKVGDAVITLLSCADSEQQMAWQDWQTQLDVSAPDYAAPEAVEALAREHGAIGR